MADTMSEEETPSTEVVFTQLQQGHIYSDTVGVSLPKLTAFSFSRGDNSLRQTQKLQGARVSVRI